MNKKWFLCLPFVLSSLASCSSSIKSDVISIDQTQFSSSDSKIITSFDNEIVVNGDNVTFSNTKTTSGASLVNSSIVINRKGKYKISGASSSVNIVVNDTDKTGKIFLVMNELELVNEEKVPLIILSADKVFLQRYENTENILSYLGNEYTYSTYNMTSTIYARDDLVINGKGNLTVNSSYLKGIDAKDYLKILGSGFLSVNAPSSQGISVNDSLRIGGSLDLNVVSEEDAIHVENDNNDAYFYMEGGNVSLDSKHDAIDVSGISSSFTGYAKFVGGSLSIKTFNQEGKSAKGIKCLGPIYEGNIEVDINATDDGLHSETSIYLTSGTMKIKCGSDAIHAEDTVYIKGGSFIIEECFEGIEANHIELKAGNIVIYALDDGLNAGKKNDETPSIKIYGGYLDITVGSGDVDGIDSNGYYLQEGGLVITRGAPNSSPMASGLDVDLGAQINKGTFICLGSIETEPKRGEKVFGDSLTASTYVLESGNWTISDLNVEFSLTSTYYGITIYSSNISKDSTINISNGITSYSLTAK